MNKNFPRGLKRSLSNEIQPDLDEIELQRQQHHQNIKVDVVGDDGEMFQNVLFETGKTSRGNLCLWHEGYCYTRNRGTNVINFRCEKRTCSATCKITLEKNQEIDQFIEGILGNNDHNHLPNPSKKLARETREEILKQITKMPKTKPSILLADVREKLSDDVFIEMGSDHALGHLIYRHKKRLFGNVDTANNLLDIKFPDFLINCKGSNILLYDSRLSRPGEEDVVLVFSHPMLLNFLKSNKIWSLDSNSFIPSKWSQNFIISTEVNGKVVVCVQSLLPRKSVRYYAEVLNAIKEAIQPITPLTFTSEFNFNALRAVNEIFPEAHLSSTMFHLGQNLLRKWRLLGMQNLYSDQIIGKIAVKTFRNILTLSLLPINQIRRAFYLLIQSSPNELNLFLEYFAKNYIGLTYWQNHNGFKQFLSTIEENNEGRLDWELPIIYPPKYPIEFWNVFDRLEYDIIKTNNLVEASNLIGKISTHHPRLSEYLTTFKKEIIEKQLENIKIEEEIITAPSSKKRKRLNLIKKEQILETLEQANYQDDGDLLDLITLLGLQIQGYVNGLRDNEKGDSDDDIED